MNQEDRRSSNQAMWSIDGLTIKDQSAFIFGWFFVPGWQLRKLRLILKASNREAVGQINLEGSKTRDDVSNAFPEHPEAFEAGFVGMGSWSRKPRHDDSLNIHAILKQTIGEDDGKTQELEIEIPKNQWQDMLSPSLLQQKLAAIRHFKHYAKRAFGLMRMGKWVMLYERMAIQVGELPQQAMPRCLTLDHIKEIGGKPDAGIDLIIDHQLGGGANQYRKQLVQQLLHDDRTVMVLTFHVARLLPVLIIETSSGQRRFSLESIQDLIQALAGIQLRSITYNTGVSFVGAEHLPGLLLALKHRHDAKLRMLIHDYFSACPSHFLLNAEGTFCNIPDLATCRNCLPNNRHGFTSLFLKDIAAWREQWGQLIQNADEVITFSNSSVELLRRAFEFWPDGKNWLQGREILVRPHQMDDFGAEPITIKHTEDLVIGIVGHITFHKGARVVQDLCQTIEETGSKEKIAIIGSLEGRTNSQIVKQTGSYQRQQLGKLIEASGVNVILFPSICPETFSYVTHEIISLGLPIACFNYGAPAERIKEYDKGLVLGSENPKNILQELRQLFQASYHSAR